MICSNDMHFSVCGPKVLAAINAAATPQAALTVADEWAARYKQLYAANATTGWTLSDQDYLEQLLDQLFGSTIGEYVAVENLMFSMALAKYLPRLSALIGFMQGPPALLFYTLVAPSPISNDFVIAKDLNDQIHQALISKIDGLMNIGWRDKYSVSVQQVRGGMDGSGPMP